MSEAFQEYNGKKIALYGLGTETERLIPQWEEKFDIVGLLDGFRDSGEMYGKSILSLQEAIDAGVELIIVVARPGSCKVIAKRIGTKCREQGIVLFDVRGRDLLEISKVYCDFKHIQGGTRSELLEKIQSAEVVSFDLFDTLIMRRVPAYTDVIELVETSLRDRGIVLPDFAKRRLASEKELSKYSAPTLEEIYANMLQKLREENGFVKRPEGNGDSGEYTERQLAELEWQIDFDIMLPREAVCEVFREAVSMGKKVVITSDCYYDEGRFGQILKKFDLAACVYVMVSCEEGTSKTQHLFDRLAERESEAHILHIGDDLVADVEPAAARGMDVFRIYSGVDLMDALGALGMESYMDSLSARLKQGLFISRLFNTPFWFETEDRRLEIRNAYDIGYLICAPMIVDFIFWLKSCVQSLSLKQILFCARDGYLLEQLYRRIDTERAVYFLTSRNAAIRAGMHTVADIDYVDSMKFFGTERESLRSRFGIDSEKLEDDSEEGRREAILEKAVVQRENYKRYIDGLSLHDDTIALIDFVAKGTVQMYLGRLFDQHLKGFYFLRLESQFMADKGLDIEAFYTDDEKDTSAIFDQYYILETILTAPHASVLEFDKNGGPVYAEESRSLKDISCSLRAQDGIIDYFDQYIHLLPEKSHVQNKKLDEILLALIGKVKITDPNFIALTIEDPFFNRMTDMKDVLG